MKYTLEFLDSQLYDLEHEADKQGYNLSDDENYINACWIVTNADFENKKEIDGTEFYKLFDLVVEKLDL